MYNNLCCTSGVVQMACVDAVAVAVATTTTTTTTNIALCHGINLIHFDNYCTVYNFDNYCTVFVAVIMTNKRRQR